MKTAPTFEMRNEYVTEARVSRDAQRKYRVQIRGEASKRMSKGEAESIALQTALTLNFHPRHTEADIRVAAKRTAAKGPGLPSDESVIRTGVSLAGRRVSLTRGAFGWFMLWVSGRKPGMEKIRGRDAALTAFGEAIAARE